MVFHRDHNTHMLCETERVTNIWLRRPQQDFIMPSVLGYTVIHTVPTLAKFSVKLLQFSFAETVQYVRQCSWCCMEGISLLITSAKIWSPIYPNLLMCLVRDSGLFVFLAQIFIWSHSVAVLSQLYLIQDKELHTHTHTHTHTSVQYPDCFLFHQCLTAWMTILCRFMSYKWHVRPILAVCWKPNCLLPHIQASGSVVPCFDLPLSQRTVSSPSLVLSTASSSSTIYIFHLYMAHPAVSSTVVYCLQSQLPTHQSANATVHCTQNGKTITIQLCHYQ